MKRLFIVLIKYIPIIQMVGMLFNNILYCFSNIYIISYILDFIIGNSITTTFLLYVCSYVFGFCKWHRFIITANIINLLIANLDAYYRIPISDIQLLIVYHFVAALFICISTYIHIKNNRDERKVKSTKKVLEEAIDNIDAGNSNHSDDELDDIISSLTKLNRGIKRISKREACERILHCSPSSFDNYIKLGLIPRGHKEYGFKELSWSEKDFDKATLARIKKYRDKQGL